MAKKKRRTAATKPTVQGAKRSVTRARVSPPTSSARPTEDGRRDHRERATRYGDVRPERDA